MKLKILFASLLFVASISFVVAKNNTTSNTSKNCCSSYVDKNDNSVCDKKEDKNCDKKCNKKESKKCDKQDKKTQCCKKK